MVKYKQFYTRMLNQNKELFESFARVYELFEQDSAKYKEQFNTIGKEINVIVRRTDNKLCAQTELSQFNKFSSGLSDKFWEIVRENYPYIDKVTK